jgi:CHAD domain-containing protein
MHLRVQVLLGLMSKPLAFDQRLEMAIAARLSLGLAKAITAASAADRPPDARVHKVRRAIKHLRALLRLARPVLGGYREANAGLRDAARLLSHGRDATVRVALLGELASNADPGSELGALAGPAVAGSLPDAAEQEKQLAGFARQIAVLAARSALWRVEPAPWTSLSKGAAKTYRAARRAMACARSTGRPADFHEWRKQIKYHAQHLDLLPDLHVRPSTPQRQALKSLGELLGRYHDLDALDVYLEREADLPADDLAVFDKLVHPLRMRLSREALRSGKALFDRKPSKVRRDIRKALKSIDKQLKAGVKNGLPG